MADAKQAREDLIRGAKKALENYPKPEQRLVNVRAIDLLAALGADLPSKPSSPTKE